MSKPSPPSTLIYDSGIHTELLLPERLGSRWREDTRLHVIVRLKNGAMRLGRVCYFDSTRLTLAQEGREGRLCDVMYSDISRILASPKVL